MLVETPVVGDAERIPELISYARVVGFACGLTTMFLHERLGIGKLLSGILVLTALYSVDLRLMGGSNVSILNAPNWLDSIDRAETAWLGIELARLDPIKLAVLVALIAALGWALRRFYKTRPGIVIRGIGDNERAIARMAISTARYKYLGLGLANAIAGFGAALLVSNQGFADVGMGTGSLVLGLAALIIGEKIVGMRRSNRDLVSALLIAAFVGMLIYQALWLAVLRLGLSPTDLKLFTAVLVVVSFVFGKQRTAFYEGRAF